MHHHDDLVGPVELGDHQRSQSIIGDQPAGIANDVKVALIGAEYPLEDYAKALRDLSERRAIGKVVVNIRPGVEA